MGLTFFLLCSYLIWMVIMEMTSLNSSSVVQLWIIWFCLVTVAWQAPLSIEFPRQEYWSELSFPSSGYLPNPGVEPTSPVCRWIFYHWATAKAHIETMCVYVSHWVMSDFCGPVDFKAHQPPLSMEFSRQEYWRGLPLPSPGDLPDPGIEPTSPALQGILSQSPSF